MHSLSDARDKDISSAKKRRRAVVATVLGNSLEWFDFAVYAFFAAIIAKNFFSTEDSSTALLKTFAVFGVGFIARPLGAIVFGLIGDKFGRKLALMIAMPMMGAGTLLVGLSPNYEQIGVFAAVLLVLGRLIQGFSAGGELGNAVAFLIEWSPANQRAFYSGFQQSSVILGTLTGSALAALISGLLPAEDVESWGWRIPFLIGGLVIAPIGFFIRAKVEETPIFLQSHKKEVASTKPQESPWKVGVKVIFTTASWIVAYYIFLIFMPSFLQKHAAFSQEHSLWASTCGLLAMMLSIPLWGKVSDKIGRKPPYFIAALFFAVVTYPAFSWMLENPTLPNAIIVSVVAGFVLGIFAGIGPALMAEMFSTSSRTTGVSVSFGLASAIIGGFAPFFSTWLIEQTGNPLSATYNVIIFSIVSFITLFFVKETFRNEL